MTQPLPGQRDTIRLIALAPPDVVTYCARQLGITVRPGSWLDELREILEQALEQDRLAELATAVEARRV